MYEPSKNSPMLNGPIEFDFTVEIERAASDVFPLIDVSDPRFAQVALGSLVKKTAKDIFELEVVGLEEHVFRMQVMQCIPNERHTSKVTIEPRVGNLVEAVEDYELNAAGDERCTLTLVTKATFSNDLSVEEIAQEVAMMSMAVEDDLTKLKIHAEEGLEAVRAYDEEQQAAFDIELDLTGFDIDWDDIEPEQ